MSLSLKCAACGAEVVFEDATSEAETTCPGCQARVRQRPGDSRMAIPVSMHLPERFQQADLKAVSHKADVLVERYRRQQAAAEQKLTNEFVLAKALEALASSIQHLEERLDHHEGTPREAAAGPNGGLPAAGPGAAERDQSSADPEGVVQLQPEAEQLRAHPVDAAVLVRREAARHARDFRRERHSQREWDPHGDRAHGPGGFRWLMERYPKTTFITTFLGAVAFAVLITLAMEGVFEAKPEQRPEELPPVETSALSELWADDPEAAQAEAMARGFLNATSVRAATPFIYEADRIKEKLERHYRPISSPQDYALTLKSRAVAPEGQSIFAYHLRIESEVPRMLVVVPEGKMPKVLWEFFAEVGDVSWKAFIDKRPPEPVTMRVWASRSEVYHPPFTAEDWQSYLLHDQAQKHRVWAYAERGTAADWRLGNALETEPVQFERHSAVMAQVRLSFAEEAEDSAGQPVYLAEIKEVAATSWLPKRFLPREEPGN